MSTLDARRLVLRNDLAELRRGLQVQIFNTGTTSESLLILVKVSKIQLWVWIMFGQS
jgi:hypothetical protein